ncbi:hypothetical protein [Clostridium sp. SM-530-WT-3G]|uniref:hypothetical protein n=1 Tax=Clostridium sp. SM-530-WT-3G TaxID=2725303 RepID=UPI00145FA434|nr:hypothetical protein [Clostridium sp. SM-530-WT-3G]NME84379.1 hypothetical protein [Clostridium sp. SM-530-WT-3G]
MIKKDIFNMNEIVTIVMAEVEAIEFMEMYGLEEEVEIPKPIESKLSSLDNKDYVEFIEKIEEMAKEVYKLKSGELNELNKCHEEIVRESENILSEFIIKE